MAKEKGSWIVRMEREIVVEIICDDCTEEEARNNPFDHSDGEEIEIDSRGYEVLRVEPNV